MSAIHYATPEEAEQAFYDAFQRADLAAMMNVWADREFIECIHPASTRLRGRSDIEASWRSIFGSGVQMRIIRSDIHRTQDSLLAIHVLYEHLAVADAKRRPAPVIATNIYQFIDGGWHMVLHHASPSPDADNAADILPKTNRTTRRLH